ncbi:MAG TPA: hypothetical protein DDW55_10515 [Gammaproteobacteria bacterium]|nr:hypothetical protein [Gammaproteobacteria bacterium]
MTWPGRNILHDAIPADGNSEYWRTLFYYNIYRFCIAIFLITASLSPLQVGSLGSNTPSLFGILSITYAALALISGVFIYQSWPRYIIICRILIATDVLFFTLFIYTSGGLGSGLELLLVITVAASGILMGGRYAMATAAIATIFLFGEHIFVILNQERKPGGFTAMGFMGLGLFVTAFFIHFLSARLRLSEVELVRHQLNIHNLSQLNQYIINKLHSGVLVVDQNRSVWLDNQRARTLVNTQNQKPRQQLSEYSPALTDATNSWIKDRTKSEQKVVLNKDTTLLVHFQPIESLDPKQAFIMLIDDLSKIEKERQNDKLIAMGHLSASIAHEIRNPLGAISHAGQLLAESDQLHDEDRRLAEIINTQSTRVNRIIQTTLELGRPSNAQIQEINLFEWLTRLLREFVQENSIADDTVELSGINTMTASFDPDQMHQVVVNLLQNALQHADPDKKPLISLELNLENRNTLPQLCIYDSGPGVPESIRERIFEPFFTTSPRGSGLGLYVARQICTGNEGALDYRTDDDNVSHFSVIFSPGKAETEQRYAQ